MGCAVDETDRERAELTFFGGDSRCAEGREASFGVERGRCGVDFPDVEPGNSTQLARGTSL